MPPKANNNARPRSDGNSRTLYSVEVYGYKNKSELPTRESIVRKIILACLNISFIIVSYGACEDPFTLEVFVEFKKKVSKFLINVL